MFSTLHWHEKGHRAGRGGERVKYWWPRMTAICQRLQNGNVPACSSGTSQLQTRHCPLVPLSMCLGCHLQHISKCQYTKECSTSSSSSIRRSSTSSSSRGAADQLPGERAPQNMCPLFGGDSRSCLLSRLCFGPR